MELALLVYGISLLPQISAGLSFLIIVASICIGANVIMIIFSTSSDYRTEKEYEEFIDRCTKRIKVFFIMVVCIGGLNILIPKEKTAWTMAGAYAAQKMVTSETATGIGNKVVTLINQKLDTFIEDGAAEAQKQAEAVAKKVIKAGKEKVVEAVQQ